MYFYVFVLILIKYTTITDLQSALKDKFYKKGGFNIWYFNADHLKNETHIKTKQWIQMVPRENLCLTFLDDN